MLHSEKLAAIQKVVHTDYPYLQTEMHNQSISLLYYLFDYKLIIELDKLSAHYDLQYHMAPYRDRTLIQFIIF